MRIAKTPVMELGKLRKGYGRLALHRDQLPESPFTLFEQWFTDACDSEVNEPNAMILATVSPAGQPVQRTVLLKYFDPKGFVFYTNYESRKAKHIEHHSAVSLLFLWLPLERQVEIQGQAERVSTAESLAYFTSRPRGSQLGAWCSPQSQIITSRTLLQIKFDEIQRKFANGQVPWPSFWGGYRIVPSSLEFWQGRPNRLHDRFLYTRDADKSEPELWNIQRLAP